jgi:thiol-disulfide isomerase/thioredoxin
MPWVTRAAGVVSVMLCVTHVGACSPVRMHGSQTAGTLRLPMSAVRTVEDVDYPPPHTNDPAATVLLFIAPDCPISNAYAPEVRRIVEAYWPRDVAVFAVHADPRVTEDVARRHAQEFGFHCPVLLDPKQELAHHAGATVTPEAAVLDREGKVVYLGRIDDRFLGFGKQRTSPTTHELRDALDAVLASRPVVSAAEPAIGCEIPPPLSANDQIKRY